MKTRDGRDGGKEKEKEEKRRALVVDSIYQTFFHLQITTVLPTAAGGDAVHVFPQNGHMQI